MTDFRSFCLLRCRFVKMSTGRARGGGQDATASRLAARRCRGACVSERAARGLCLEARASPSAFLRPSGRACRGLIAEGEDPASGRLVRASAPTRREVARLKAHEEQKGRQRHGQAHGEGSTLRRVRGLRILRLFVRRGARGVGCEPARVGGGGRRHGHGRCRPGAGILSSHHRRRRIHTGCRCRTLLRSGPVSQKRDQSPGREPDRPTRHTAYPQTTPASAMRPVSILAVRRPR